MYCFTHIKKAAPEEAAFFHDQAGKLQDLLQFFDQGLAT
jgi:hypothetical protein